MTALPTETELKLWLHPDDAGAFAGQPRLRRAKATQQALHTLYFDTPDFRLAKIGVALRVRKVGRRWVQTLKTEGEQSGGLSRRLELETPVARPQPDFAQFPARLVAKLIPPKRRARLSPVYETRFRRTTWNLRAADGSRIELALDVGEILAGGRSEPVCEVELELKSGTPASLHALAGVLAQHVLLIPCDASKAARGARLAAGLAPQPLKATAPVLRKKMPLCTGLAAILRADLAQLQANLPGFLLTADPEYCHQARVAIRRLRSAARLFRKLCPLPAERLAEVAALGDALGRARDADVFVLETLPRLREILSPGQFTLLARRAGRHRRAQREAALAAVRLPATGACLIALQQWLTQLEATAAGGRLAAFAAGKLEVLFDRVAVSASHFAELSPEARHALRVQLKRLRYASEHFSGLVPMPRSFQAGLADLQDGLGRLNDQVVALREVAGLNPDGRLTEAVAAMQRWAEAENRANLPALEAALQLFSQQSPPW